MRKHHVASLLATAALVGAALPIATAGTASAGTIKCSPTSKNYTVGEDKVAVHSGISASARVIDYVYKNNQVHASWDCTNSSGNPWVCIADCHVDEDAITGHWVYRGYLRG